MAMIKIFFVLFLATIINADDLQKMEFLRDLRKDNISGTFTQTKQISGVKIVANGEFELSNGVFIQNITSPLNLRIKIDENGIFEWNGSEFVPSKTLFDKELFLAILGLDFERLKQDFRIKASGDKMAWNVELVPLGIIAKVFKVIKLSGGEHLKSLELIENNGDFSAYDFRMLE